MRITKSPITGKSFIVIIFIMIIFNYLFVILFICFLIRYERAMDKDQSKNFGKRVYSSRVHSIKISHSEVQLLLSVATTFLLLLFFIILKLRAVFWVSFFCCS